MRLTPLLITGRIRLETPGNQPAKQPDGEDRHAVANPNELLWVVFRPSGSQESGKPSPSPQPPSIPVRQSHDYPASVRRVPAQFGLRSGDVAHTGG
jgi:hypothetical protein